MEEIQKFTSLVERQVIVTGMYLYPEFELTYRDIEAGGFRIDRKLEMLLSADNSSTISKLN
jgi:GDP/UDP-N,N'-diacetylbacillosamine 2-epimerase (hydrolysing)